MRTVRYALVGFGGIAENRIAKEGFGLGGGVGGKPANATLVGATDLNPARRQAAAALGVRWYNDLAELLADKAVDAVFIATSNGTHAKIALEALAAGRPCLVEKPMATTLADAEAMAALARERGLSLAIDHMMTKNAFNLKAASLVESGALGNVNDLCLHMECLYGTTPEEAASWRCSDLSELGGPIGDMASHCLYMAEALLKDKVASVSCAYHPKRLAIKVEDGATIYFQTAGGVGGSARVSFAEPRGGLVGTLSNLGYEIYGSKGALRGYGTLFQLSGHPGEPVSPRLTLETAEGAADVQVDNVANIYKAMIEAHARSILDGPRMDGEDGLRNLKLVLAAHESARQGGAKVGVCPAPVLGFRF